MKTRGPGKVFTEFLHSAVRGSVILLACTVAALVMANSRWRDLYEGLQHARVGVIWETGAFELSLHTWINDGLMAIFFFVVGLEIKRELVVGRLSSVRLALLPGAAAIGGMLVPAALYILLNEGGPGGRGWGIPMATDIAFALGVLALGGERVPVSLKVFLTALAIVDDLGAVLVIALFYTESIRASALLVAAAFLGVLALLLRVRVRRLEVLLFPVLGVWLAVFASGLHATVAGILAALIVPMRPAMHPRDFVELAQRRLPALAGDDVTRRSLLVDEDKLDTVAELYDAAVELQPPSRALERVLHPLQAYVVLPLFAFFNAGIPIDGSAFAALGEPVALGVVVGLVLGKPVGIVAVSWLAVRSGLARLPEDITWKGLFAVSCLGGIGFTMSLFVSELAFKAGPALREAKMGILAASLVAGVIGYVLVRVLLPPASAGARR